MPTPSMEDYLEQIYLLIKTKGYARVSEVAEILGVRSSSVTKMTQKLDQENYVIYEKYRGIRLTDYGEEIGKTLVDRHELLENFFRLIGVEDGQIYREVEEVEHHLSPKTLDCIIDLVQYFQEDEQRKQDFKKIHRYRKKEKGTLD